MCFRRQGTQRHARRDEAFADFGDRFDFIDLDRLMTRIEIKQITQIEWRTPVHTFGIALVHLVAVGRDGSLQSVDQASLESVGFTAIAIAIDAADGERHNLILIGFAVEFQRTALNAREPDARDTRWHTGEKFGDQRAGKPDGLEVVAAAIGREDGDAHLGHDLEKTIVDRLLVAGNAVLERVVRQQTAAVPFGDAFLGKIGVDRGGTDARRARRSSARPDTRLNAR